MAQCTYINFGTKPIIKFQLLRLNSVNVRRHEANKPDNKIVLFLKVDENNHALVGCLEDDIGISYDGTIVRDMNRFSGPLQECTIYEIIVHFNLNKDVVSFHVDTYTNGGRLTTRELATFEE